MSDSKFNTSLEDKPRANVKSFIREVIADAGTRCTGQIQHGLLYLVLTDLQWRTLEFNKTQTSAGIMTILPKFANKLPQRPADEDRSAAWTDYKMLKEEYIAVENATKDLKDKLLRSIPQEDRDELEDSEYGTLDLTILQVIQHLTTKYGTMEGTDFESLEQQLLIPLSSQAGLVSHISTFKKIFLQFEASKQPKSEFDKCKLFKSSIMHIPGTAKALDNYSMSYPLVEDQAFEAMAAHVKRLSPNFQVTSADLGYAGQSTQTAPNAAFFQSQEFTTMLATAIANAAQANIPPPALKGGANKDRGNGGRGNGGRGRTDTGRGRGSGRGRGQPQKYCYAHGYNDIHSSSECRTMYRDTTNYSDQDRRAIDPSTGGIQ